MYCHLITPWTFYQVLLYHVLVLMAFILNVKM